MNNSQSIKTPTKKMNCFEQKENLGVNEDHLDSAENICETVKPQVSPDIFSHLLSLQTSIESPLSEWSNWSYNPNDNSTTRKNIQLQNYELVSTANQKMVFDDNFINLSQMSVWSDWNYENNNSNVTNCSNQQLKRNQRLKRFLPPSVYELLPYKYIKILGDKNVLQSTQCAILNVFEEIESNSVFDTDNFFQNFTNIQAFHNKPLLHQCTISKELINFFQVKLLFLKM